MSKTPKPLQRKGSHHRQWLSDTYDFELDVDDWNEKCMAGIAPWSTEMMISGTCMAVDPAGVPHRFPVSGLILRNLKTKAQKASRHGLRSDETAQPNGLGCEKGRHPERNVRPTWSVHRHGLVAGRGTPVRADR